MVMGRLDLHLRPGSTDTLDERGSQPHLVPCGLRRRKSRALCLKMKKTYSHIGHAVLGLGEGGLVGIMPLPLNLGFILLFLALWPISLARSKTPVERTGHLIKIAVGIATVVAAILLPVKQLDGRVGPIHYEKMSLSELCDRLNEDWNVYVTAYDPPIALTSVTFRTEGKMSRRQVLEKLANDMNMDLQIGSCGTGATFLFGSLPCFTRLGPREAQQDESSEPSEAARTAPSDDR